MLNTTGQDGTGAATTRTEQEHDEGGDAAVLARLRAEYAGRWRIWRGTRDDGRPPSLWCATRLDPAAGADPTVIEDSARRLVAALARQAGAVAGGGSVPGRDAEVEALLARC